MENLPKSWRGRPRHFLSGADDLSSLVHFHVYVAYLLGDVPEKYFGAHV